MARQKISEFRAKTMLARGLEQPYAGISIDTNQPLEPQLVALPADGRFVVKVDQAVKKRMKQGLVKLDRSKADLEADLQEFAAKGFSSCLIEPLYPHEATAEHYLAFSHGRDGTTVAFSTQGGIDIESAADNVQELVASDENLEQVATTLMVPVEFLKGTRTIFDNSSTSFLEINPLVSTENSPLLLDVAAEVDGEAAHLSREYWSAEDYRVFRKQTPEEVIISELAATSRASLRYEVINPDGAIFLLLSGGGASIVVADEVNNRGFGHLLGNYGEYSGNPSEAETFAYTEQLLHSLLQSNAERKVLIIAGGVANFTDVRTTFSGVIRAIQKLASELADQGVTVFVRRGGPHEVEGLALMQSCLEQAGLLGAVHGPELPLAESVSDALQSLGVAA
jgi:succinyl-CoA synthetase beta subunit